VNLAVGCFDLLLGDAALTLENLTFFNVSDEVKFVYLHVGKNTSEHDVMLCGLRCQLTIRMDIIQQAEI
jgi:hypothetical protein